MELYHIINRGVDGRSLFSDAQDYARFVHDLYEFNDAAPALEFHRANSRTANVGPQRSYIRKRLVEIHGWCLMENHYHLIISELVEGGLLRFMTKMNVGYARYYNDRHERNGHLFQGKTKKILIKSQVHFLYILHYVHLNPLDYLPGAKKWRERDNGDIKDIPKILEYLKNYRWSSYLDYCGNSNFPSILTKSLFGKTIGPNFDDFSLKEYLSDRSFDELELKSLEYAS